MKNGEFKIEKRVPIPKSRNKLGYAATMRQLKAGESVMFPAPARNIRMYAAKILGKGNYAVRQDGSKSRVWRIK